MLDIKEEDVVTYSKLQWKVLLKRKRKIQIAHDLLERMKRYKKINYFKKKEEDFEIKDYFKTMTLEDCRMKGALQVAVTETLSIQINKKN